MVPEAPALMGEGWGLVVCWGRRGWDLLLGRWGRDWRGRRVVREGILDRVDLVRVVFLGERGREWIRGRENETERGETGTEIGIGM